MIHQNNLHHSKRLTQPHRFFETILRIFFKLLYHQLAWTYDWIASAVSLGAWQEWTLSTLPYLHGPRVLEIGYGPGHLQISMCQKGISVFGLDESSQMAKLATKRMINQGLSPGLIRGLAQALPFADDCIHQVVMTFPADFIFNPKTILEIHRILVQGGTAIVLPFAWITGHTIIERAFAWINRITGETPQWDEKSIDPLKQMGFDISWEMVDYPSSKVLIIQMKKSN